MLCAIAHIGRASGRRATGAAPLSICMPTALARGGSATTLGALQTQAALGISTVVAASVRRGAAVAASSVARNVLVVRASTATAAATGPLLSVPALAHMLALPSDLTGEDEEEPLRGRWSEASRSSDFTPPAVHVSGGQFRAQRRAFSTMRDGGSGRRRRASAPFDGGARAIDTTGDEAEGVGEEEEEEVPPSEAPPMPVDDVEGLSARLKARLAAEGIKTLFPVQTETLSRIIAGNDVVVRSRTGSGKTLAFAIPVIEMLSRQKEGSMNPRCIVLAPTRELAKQIESEFLRIASPLKTLAIYGGMSYVPQQRALRSGIDIIVGTPGRVMDLLESKHLSLSEVQFAVLDESDEMLRMGFKEDCEKIFAAMPPPASRQTMLWSATVPSWIRTLASSYCAKPVFVDLVGDEAHKLPATASFSAHLVSQNTRNEVFTAVLNAALKAAKGSRALVFTDTKREATDLANVHIPGVKIKCLTGDLSQVQREIALNDFKAGRVDVLCATDVAARGLDVPEVDTVIHFRLPQSQEAFVHRSGRTARANRDGNVIALMDSSEWELMARWEKALQFNIVIKAPPQLDVKLLLEEGAGKLLARLTSVPMAVRRAVSASGLKDRVVKVAGSPEAALETVLALAALGLEVGSAAPLSGINISLLTGERGLVTVGLQPHSPEYESVVGKPSPFSAGDKAAAADGTAARTAVLTVFDVCGVAAGDRPRRLLIAPDSAGALVFDLPAATFEAMQEAIALATAKSGGGAGEQPLLVRLPELPLSVKTSIMRSAPPTPAKDGRFRRGRTGGGGGGGGGGYGGGGDRRREFSGESRGYGGGGGGDRRREFSGESRGYGGGGDRRESSGGGYSGGGDRRGGYGGGERRSSYGEERRGGGDRREDSRAPRSRAASF